MRISIWRCDICGQEFQQNVPVPILPSYVTVTYRNAGNIETKFELELCYTCYNNTRNKINKIVVLELES